MSLLQKCPDTLWDAKWGTEFFSLVKRREREGDYSLASSVEDRNERFCVVLYSCCMASLLGQGQLHLLTSVTVQAGL